jgi:hypothetical protein
MNSPSKLEPLAEYRSAAKDRIHCFKRNIQALVASTIHAILGSAAIYDPVLAVPAARFLRVCFSELTRLVWAMGCDAIGSPLPKAGSPDTE